MAFIEIASRPGEAPATVAVATPLADCEVESGVSLEAPVVGLVVGLVVDWLEFPFDGVVLTAVEDCAVFDGVAATTVIVAPSVVIVVGPVALTGLSWIEKVVVPLTVTVPKEFINGVSLPSVP